MDSLTNTQFAREFKNMINNCTIQKIYCKKCYDKHNLKELFSYPLKLYILNCEDIYIYGDYIKVFVKIAKNNGLLFFKKHRLDHKVQDSINAERRRVRLWRRGPNDYITRRTPGR